jgi:hypothetical protein
MNAIKKFIVLVLLFGTIKANPQNFNLPEYLEQHKTESDSVFLSNFPFKDFLYNFQFDDFISIENIRQNIIKSKRNPEYLLYRATQKYYELKPIDAANIAEISSTVQIGLFYFKINDRTSDTSLVYRQIGREILKRCIHVLERQIKAGAFNAESPEIKLLYKKLEEVKLELKIDKSRFRKLVDNILAGNWPYIFSRIKNKFIEKPILSSTILLIVILTTVFSTYKLIKYLKRKKAWKRKSSF